MNWFVMSWMLINLITVPFTRLQYGEINEEYSIEFINSYLEFAYIGVTVVIVEYVNINWFFFYLPTRKFILTRQKNQCIIEPQPRSTNLKVNEDSCYAHFRK